MKLKRTLTVLFLSFFLCFCFLAGGCLFKASPSQKGTQAEKTSRDEEKKAESKTSDYTEELASHLNDPPWIYVAANDGSGHAVTLDSQKDVKTSSLPLDAEIVDVAVRPDGSQLYATSLKGNKIFIVDLEANEVIKTLDSKDEPASVVFTPDGRKAYVTHYASNYVSIIDTKKMEVVETIQVGKHPAAIALSFDGKKAYVGHTLYVNTEQTEKKEIGGIEIQIPKLSEGSKSIAVIDLATNKVIKEIPLQGFCSGIAVRPDDAIVYATVSSLDVSGLTGGEPQKGLKDSLAVIDAAKNEIFAEIEFDQGSGPKAVTFTPNGEKAYTICGARDQALVVDAKKHEIIKKIPLGLGG